MDVDPTHWAGDERPALLQRTHCWVKPRGGGRRTPSPGERERIRSKKQVDRSRKKGGPVCVGVPFASPPTSLTVGGPGGGGGSSTVSFGMSQWQ